MCHFQKSYSLLEIGKLTSVSTFMVHGDRNFRSFSQLIVLTLLWRLWLHSGDSCFASFFDL